jgi:hypothetical protein
MFFLYNIDLHNLKIQKMLHTMHPLYSTVEKVIDGLSILQVDAKHEDKETVSSPFTDAQAMSFQLFSVIFVKDLLKPRQV